MDDARFQVRRRVFVALGLLLVVAGVWRYWVIYGTGLPAGQSTGPQAFVQVVGKGQQAVERVIQERTDLLDPTPLFIPTPRNYGQGGLPARVVRQPGQVFDTYDAKLNFSDTGLPKYQSSNDLGGETLPELVTRGNEAPFDGFGQIDQAPRLLEKRAGYIEVKSLKDGKLNIASALQQVKLPLPDFDPVEFIVAVGAGGLIGEPILTAGSGSDETDVVLRDYMVKVFRLGEKLPPGRYAVTVGP